MGRRRRISGAAAALTPEPSRGAQRALAAAQADFEAGALDDALAQLASADSGAVDDLQRVEVKLLGARIAFALRRGGDAPPLLLEAARNLETIDPKRARATYLEALSAAIYARRVADGAGVVEISAAALAGPPPPQPPGPSDLLLQGLAVGFTDGYAMGVPILREAFVPSVERRCCHPRRVVGSGSPARSGAIHGTTRPGRCS